MLQASIHLDIFPDFLAGPLPKVNEKVMLIMLSLRRPFGLTKKNGANVMGMDSIIFLNSG